MRRSGFLAKVLGAAVALTMVANGAVAEDISPNANKAGAAMGVTVTAANARMYNSMAGEMYPDVMLGSMSIQREFRRALPSIYSYSQTAHYQNRADVGSEGAYASASEDAYAAVAACPTTMCAPGSKWVMWDVPFMMDETRRRDDSYLGYRNRVSGFATGISRMLGETSAIGLAVGYDARKLDGRDDYHMRNRGDTFHAALYGGTSIGHFFVDGYAGYSRSWNRSERNVEAPGATTQLKANYNDTVLSAGLKASYVWILGNDARITPSIGLDYSHVRMGSFSERLHYGNAGYRMRVDKSSYDNLAMPIMVSANKTFASNFLTFKGAPALWTPEVRGGWVPQFGADKARARVDLAGGTSSYRTTSSTLADSYGTVGAGLKMKLADKYIFAVEYDYSFASKYSNHSVTAMYGVSF